MERMMIWRDVTAISASIRLPKSSVPPAPIAPPPNQRYRTDRQRKCRYLLPKPRHGSIGTLARSVVDLPRWSSPLLTGDVASFPPSGHLSSSPSNLDATLGLQARRIIRATGQYLDKISVRYFKGSVISVRSSPEPLPPSAPL
ncbi:hypothetical protein EYZ11_005670 [Aspergillus tanneri]|uniref:Uncharacterized protein n=1 Tax=Aspergillus tanneri TaxID=1220188 RepID=A0A4S3JHF3_9EURO|nr:hypothetical protein EYZ11_005670 [Aspergillus tanneri]